MVRERLLVVALLAIFGCASQVDTTTRSAGATTSSGAGGAGTASQSASSSNAGGGDAGDGAATVWCNLNSGPVASGDDPDTHACPPGWECQAGFQYWTCCDPNPSSDHPSCPPP